MTRINCYHERLVSYCAYSPLRNIRKVFGALIQNVCHLHIICAYMTYLHFDVVLGGENLKLDIFF